MGIISNGDYASGKPCIEGHRIWVGHIVGHVYVAGIEAYIEDYDLDDLDIRDKIREAVEYCRTQQCDEDDREGRLVKYCQGCSKDGSSSWEGWGVAQELYELNYD